MRIGAALERLLSPQASGEDDETGGAGGAGAFRAEIDAAVARERARRAPKVDDHAAAIVLDPRLVLSLQTRETATPAEPMDARDTRAESRDSSAMDSAQASKGFQQAEHGEAEVSGKTDAAERDQSPSGAEAASASRVERPHGEDKPAIESAESANESGATPVREGGGGAEIGFERAALSAARALQSVAALGDEASVSPVAVRELAPVEAGRTAAVVQKTAALASSDVTIPLGTRAARSGAALDESPSRDASVSEPVAVALDASTASAQDFSATSDDQRDPLRDETLAADGVEVAGAVSGGGAGEPATASFATMLLDASRTATASARPHATTALAQEPPAYSHVAATVDRDAVLSLLSERLAGALRAGQREVVVRLSPPNLGTLRVRFSIDEQRVSARVEVSDPAVHRALEAGVADLRGALLRQDVELRSLTFAAAEHDGQKGGRSPSDAKDGNDQRTHEGRGASTTTSPAIRRGRNRSAGLDITA